jgi:hypothetical protein
LNQAFLFEADFRNDCGATQRGGATFDTGKRQANPI